MATTTAIIPDIHIPAEDKKAVRWAVRTLKQQNPKHVILLGDVLNLDSVSRFSKSLKDQLALPIELQRARKFLHWLAEQFPSARFTYLYGNHEARLYRYLLNHAAVLAELPELRLRHLLGIPDKWQTLDYGDYVMEQGVLLQHGKKWGRTACRQNLMFGCNSIQGHSHRVSLVQHGRPDGSVIYAAELGCLCSIKQSYTSLNDWSHACGILRKGQLTIFTPNGKRAEMKRR